MAEKGFRMMVRIVSALKCEALIATKMNKNLKIQSLFPSPINAFT